MNHYRPDKWYWIVGGDTSRAWSSAAGAYVQQWPTDRVTRIGSGAELSAVLRPHGLAIPTPVAADVKDECRRRILAAYPEWKQTNMTARGVELQDVWRRVGSWTTGEQSEADALASAWGWIKAVRAASDVIEAMQPIPADYADNSRWPA